jgi:hypothetical protein
MASKGFFCFKKQYVFNTMLLKTLQTRLNAKTCVNFERNPKERHFLQGEELPEGGKVD